MTEAGNGDRSDGAVPSRVSDSSTRNPRQIHASPTIRDCHPRMAPRKLLLRPER
jgi:hypothetical protein